MIKEIKEIIGATIILFVGLMIIKAILFQIN